MVTIKIDDSDIKKLLGDLGKKLHDLTPAMKEVAGQLEATIMANFKAQGRPRRWKPSKRALREHGETLRDSGILRNSIQPDYGRDYAEVGTSVRYAPTHQFGARKGAFGRRKVRVRSHTRRTRGKTVSVREHYRIMDFPWGDIPARPFMVAPDEDLDEIAWIVARFLSDGQD